MMVDIINKSDLQKKNINLESKNIKAIESLLICIYQIILLTFFLQNSMLRYNVNPKSVVILQLIATITLLFFSFFLRRLTVDANLLLGLALVVAGSINMVITHYTNFFVLSVIVLSLRNVSPPKVLKATTVVLSLSLIIIFLLYLTGQVQNLLYYRGGVERNSFGMIYPLTTSGYLFSLSVAVALLTKRHITFISILLFCVSFLCFSSMGARNDAICILMLALFLLMKPKLKNIKKIGLSSIIAGITVAAMVFVNFLTVVIPFGSPLYPIFNTLLSGRLGLQSTLLSEYGLKLFGQFIPENGNGGIEGQNLLLSYFYVDNSYARLLFMGGIFFFTIFALIIFLKMRKLLSTRNLFLAGVFLIVVINGFTQESFQSPAFNILLPLFLMSDGYNNLQINKEKI